jgi:hypothetical protein
MCDAFICPACLQNESSQNEGAVFALRLPDGLEDVLCFLLCPSCASHIHPNDPTHPDRVTLVEHLNRLLTQLYTRGDADPYAITTLKTLMLHQGNWRDALEIGWPHDARTTDCNVAWIPGVLYTVEPKEPNNG